MTSATDKKLQRLGADSVANRVEPLNEITFIKANVGQTTEFNPRVGETMAPRSIDLRVDNLDFANLLVLSQICDTQNLRVTTPDHIQSGGSDVTVRLVRDS